MAAMVVVQLFIAAVMMASLAYYPLLLAIHKPLGIVILIFIVFRIGNLFLHRPPPAMSTMGPWERRFAKGSEILLYALLLIQPLIGWAMLSAAGGPLTIGPVQLPPIAPEQVGLFGLLRIFHSVAAYLLFLTFTAHLCAVLFHTVVLRDGLLSRMAPWTRRLTSGESDFTSSADSNPQPVTEGRGVSD
ncbi:MAG: cytochrome b/b6 domain-containing protein [Brevibacterium sp.]|nr:cytochrome b/b6 domain-containing protein [Brevibacterium sp.]